LQQHMQQQQLTRAELARRMGASHGALDRLLDPNNPSVTLLTLERAAKALGQRIRIELAAGLEGQGLRGLRGLRVRGLRIKLGSGYAITHRPLHSAGPWVLTCAAPPLRLARAPQARTPAGLTKQGIPSVIKVFGFFGCEQVGPRFLP
jgi:transcriptional regulator with XRE-family HTH domain